jgi:hypothetical protein
MSFAYALMASPSVGANVASDFAALQCDWSSFNIFFVVYVANKVCKFSKLFLTYFLNPATLTLKYKFLIPSI